MSKRTEEEYALFKMIEESIENKALKQRLSYLLKWYDGKAQKNRHCYHILHILSVLLPSATAALGLFTFLGGEQIITAISSILSLLTAFLLHLLNQFRCYENWVRYRSTAEVLKSEVFRCLYGDDTYCGEIHERERRLAIKVEEIAKGEVVQWQALHEEHSEQGSDSSMPKHE